MRSRVKIAYVRSGVSTSLRHRRTLRALGLKKLGQSVLHVDGPSLRGMLRLVAHLVSVEEVTGAGGSAEEMRSPTRGMAAEHPRSETAGKGRSKGGEVARDGSRAPAAAVEASPASKPVRRRKKKAEDS